MLGVVELGVLELLVSGLVLDGVLLELLGAVLLELLELGVAEASGVELGWLDASVLPLRVDLLQPVTPRLSASAIKAAAPVSFSF